MEMPQRLQRSMKVKNQMRNPARLTTVAITLAASSVVLAHPAEAATSYQIRTRLMRDCIEIRDSRVDTGAPIQTWTCLGQAGSKWQVRRPPNYNGRLRWIYNPGSRKCLSINNVESGTPAFEARAQLEPCEWRGARNGWGDDSVWYFDQYFIRTPRGPHNPCLLTPAIDGLRTRVTRNCGHNQTKFIRERWPH